MTDSTPVAGDDDVPAAHDTAGPDHPGREHHHPDHQERVELRRARREFLLEAAIEAEKETGRHERTDEEAKHSLWMRLARLIGGWILLLLGLAAIPLPGPGWLMVLLGLSLLPYRWTENLIRQIRRRVPGIPEDGRIPTRTWVVTGLLIALTTAGSIWWGLRSDDDGPGRAQPAAAERNGEAGSDGSGGTGPRLAVASTADRLQLSGIYGEVAARTTDGDATVSETPDPCAALLGGDADLALFERAEAATCFGDAADDPAALAQDPGVKLYAPVASGGSVFLVAVRTDAIAIDDEAAELTLDAVSALISAGADVSGDPERRAVQFMEDAGVVE